MKNRNIDTIIIGAGLSGLTTAHVLKQHGYNDFIVLEARERIGGRIWTQDNIDLGGTWLQEHHEALIKLLDDLGIKKFRQYTEGKSAFMYSSMAPFQYFNNDQETAAFRISGGSGALIEKLSEDVADQIILNHPVVKLENQEDRMIVYSQDERYEAQRVILALPPQLLLHIACSPALPQSLIQTVTATHTWMSNAIKVGVTFNKPFWRELGLSGTMIGHVAPVIELYDHTNRNTDSFHLMGFINEGIRHLSIEERKERILVYLEKHFGSEIRNYSNYLEKDWSTDPWTSLEKLHSVYMAPTYGLPIFNGSFYNNRLWFSAAETSAIHGGYMDGAVHRGKWAAQKLLSL